MFLISLSLLNLLLVAFVFGAPAEDLIKSLPGLPFDPGFDQYSGYLNASTDANDQFFYWFMEAQTNATAAPLYLWLTGGPGCSSLGGLLEENGPFRPNPDGKTLYENKFGWNKGANMLYLESPAGVGFSYSEDGNYKVDDDTVTENHFVALQSFFKLYPEYNETDFFLTGESYAGMYLPLLAARIIKGMDSGDFPKTLKGVQIGNPILSYMDNANSIIPLMYYRGVIGYEEFEAVNFACCNETVLSMPCNYSAHLGQHGKEAGDYSSDNTTCGNMSDHIANTLVGYSLNDPYNLYQDCYTSSQKQRLERAFKFNYPTIVYPVGDSQQPDLARIINYDSTDPEWGFDCWQDDALTKYLSRDDVQTALHVRKDKIPFAGSWVPCSDNISNVDYTIKYMNMSNQFTQIIHAKNYNIRILIYNGDVDSQCNFMGDQFFIRGVAEVNNLQSDERHPWYYRGQIAGYIQNFGGKIDLLTVKGSGHFVPLDRAGPALQMVYNFVQDTGNYSTEVPYDTTLKPLMVATTTTEKPNGAGAAGISAFLAVMASLWLILNR